MRALELESGLVATRLSDQVGFPRVFGVGVL